MPQALFCCAVLAGCAQTGSVGQSVANFDPKQIAKADIDRVADLHRRELFASLRVLATKLYRRNPQEWKKSGHASLDEALDRLLDPRSGWRLPALGGKTGTDAIVFALSADYGGDRVAAFIVGLGGMFDAAFDHKTEFFLLDELDPQRLYNSARNLEIAAWKLANAKDANGNLLLLSNEAAISGQPANLSFEREFGRMIGNFDLLAKLIADKSNRTLAHVSQSLATAVFLPVVALQ